MTDSSTLQGGAVSRDVALAIEGAAIAIARLDSRISASIARSAWFRRAAWSGYATALQLQGGEIDEIDVFSWGCGLSIPSRPRRVSNTDEFAAFADWMRDIKDGGGPQWRDRLPFTPAFSQADPKCLSLLEVLHRYCRRDPSIAPWLATPILIRGLGVSQMTLPCLVAGAKAFRWRASLPDEMRRSVLRALASAARLGLDRLDAIERDRARAAIVVHREYRSSSLTKLLALASVTPLLSPQSVATSLDMTVGGAGKLLTRASDLDLLIEVSGRRAWRLYLPPDLAIAFGFKSAPRGRPPKLRIDPLADHDLAGTLDAFDQEMADIDKRLARAGIINESAPET